MYKRTHVKLPCTPGSEPVRTIAQHRQRGTSNYRVCELVRRLKHPELISNYPVHPVPSRHEKLSYDPCLEAAGLVPCYSQTMVRAGSKGLNHHELMSNYPVHQVPSVKRWFKLVRRGWTTPNSCQTTIKLPHPWGRIFKTNPPSPPPVSPGTGGWGIPLIGGLVNHHSIFTVQQHITM